MIGTTKTGPGNGEPIVLENIILYGMDGRPAVTYTRLKLDGEAVRGDDGKYLIYSQDECNRYFAARGDGRRLPALPELYAIIERLYKTKHPALRGIVNDLQTNWFGTGTTIDYSKNIIIHPGVETINCPIPSENYSLDDVVKNNAGKDAVQALLMCRNVSKAVTVLNEASGKKPYLWAPSTESRIRMLERAVWLHAGAVGFSLGCLYYPIVGFGRFRGVQVEGACESQGPCGTAASVSGSELEVILEEFKLKDPAELREALQLYSAQLRT